MGGSPNRACKSDWRAKLFGTNPHLTGRWCHVFILPQRMNNETDDSNADAGVRNIKCGPGVGQRDVQIEEQEIDNVAVCKAIS